MATLLDRVLAARRESRRVEFKEAFDASPEAWCAVVRDVVAIANSGGGAILFGVDNKGRPTGRDLSAVAGLDPARIADELHRYTDSHFADFDLVEVAKDGAAVIALVIGESVTPIVFSSPGTYAADGERKSAFSQGAAYFRHGAKSEPGTTEDLAQAIERRVKAVRRSWLNAVAQVVKSPVGAAAPALPSEVRDSDSPTATPIRVVDDPRAPAFRVIDYDRTHPYRQKELLGAFRAARPDVAINQFDLQAVRRVYDVDANPEFTHKSLYGTRQYSPRFLEWLLEQAKSDPAFFTKAREEFQRSRK
ncbi:MAG: RNA-binding domain-containing protein [Thermoanaerobaculia bacterium]